MKVRNLINANGNTVANQFVIEDGNEIFFQSYDSLVCKVVNGKVILGCDFDYSRTTAKHLHTFMKEYAYMTLAKCENSISSYKSFSDMLRKAIKKGIIQYDGEMV